MLHKEDRLNRKRLSKISELCPYDVYMNMVEVNRPHFLTLFLTMGYDTVYYRMNTADETSNFHLNYKESQHCWLIWGVHVGNLPSSVRWNHRSYLEPYPVIVSKPHTFLFGPLQSMQNESTHLYPELTLSVSILQGCHQAITPYYYRSLHYGSYPFCLQYHRTAMYAMKFEDVQRAKKRGYVRQSISCKYHHS